jgi:hypothetical protein
MSFDIVLKPDPGKTLDATPIRGYFETQPYCRFTDPAQSAITYANPLTGVQARFVLRAFERTAGMDGASIYANLNYARPAFFAYEVMMVVEHLAGTFDLMVYDPQTERSMPADGCAEALTQSWSRGNEATVALVRDTGTILPVLDRQRARSVDGRLNLFNSRYMLRLLRRYSCRMMKRDERKALRRGSRMAT